MSEKQEIMDMLTAYDWNYAGQKILASGETVSIMFRTEERVFIKEDGNWCYMANTTLLETLEGKPNKVYGHGRESLDAFFSDDWND